MPLKLARHSLLRFSIASLLLPVAALAQQQPEQPSSLEEITANLSWTRGPLSVFVQQRYLDGGTLDRNLVEGDRTLVLPPGISTIDDNSIPSTMYTDLGVRYTLGREEQWEIFGNVNNLFDQEPRATAQILGRAGVNEFNDALYDVLGRRMVVGARLSF